MMMDRNREASRRGSMAAVNGALSRRRQRTGSSSLRDSPEDDGGMELQESGRLRDRAAKKDRDRDRSNRNKRRRGDRLLHGSSNREEGEDSSEESVDEDEEDDDDDHNHPSPPSTSASQQRQTAAAAAMGPASSSNPMQSSTSSAVQPNNNNNYHHGNHQQQHQHQHRKSLPAKVVRAPPVWKVADEMIGVSIPRKARSASAKRSHECWISGSGAGVGGGGGGGSGAGTGEPVHRQASTSPARPSPPAPAASATPISPSSSSASVRKKMKPLSGGGSNNKLRPPKNSKPPSSVQDIEFEVAEVLFGMTRQFPSKPETANGNKMENGTCNDAKSRVSSPNSVSPSAAAAVAQTSPVLPPPPNSNSSSGPAVVAPKRKRPRPVKMDDESASSHSNSPAVVAPVSVSSSAKPDVEKTTALELPQSKPEKDKAVVSSPAVENGPVQAVPEPSSSSQKSASAAPSEIQQEPAKPELDAAPESLPPAQLVERPEPSEIKDEAVSVSVSKQSSKVELDMNCDEASTTTKDGGRFESPKGEKFKIDLMAPPPGKSSPDADGETDFIMSTDLKMREEAEVTTRVPEEKAGKKVKLEMGDPHGGEKPPEKSLLQELDSKKRPAADLSLDVDNKLDKTSHITTNKQPLPKQQHQLKVPKTETKPETKVQTGSIPLPMTLAGWPGSLPTFGYMGQLPSLPAAAFPMDVNAGSSKAPQFPSPQLRLKRCATHCYIAQNISYHQQIMKLQQFWPAAPGAAPVYGGKPPYNLNVMPPSESIVGNPLQQGAVPVRNMGPSTTASQQDKQSGGPAIASFNGNPSKDMNPVANALLDTFQQRQPASQSSSQAASTSNMLHGPALFFPLGQQQQAAASSTVIWSGAAIKPGAGSGGSGNAAPSNNSSASSAVSSAAGTAPAATTMSFSYGNLPPGEAHYLAILQNNGYPYPIPAHVGAPPPQYRGNHAHPVPFFNGSFYASHLFPASQIPHQAHAQQQQPHPAVTAATAGAQQGHQNASTSTGSTSSQKHAHQQNRVPAGAASTTTNPGAVSHVLLPSMKPAQQLQQRMKTEGGEAGPEDGHYAPNTRGGAASSSQAQKALPGPNFSTIPVHPQDLALISAAAAMGNSTAASATADKNSSAPPQSLKMELPHSQAFAMSFPPYTGGAVSPAAMAQNHSLFQNLPEAARHSFQYMAVAAAAAAAHGAQQKKPHGSVVVDEGKASAGDATAVDDEKKATPGSGKQHPPLSGFQSHSLALPVGDHDPPTVSNSIDSSSSGCNLNLIPASSIQGGRLVSNRPPSAMPGGATTSSAASGTVNVLGQQHQHQIAQLRQQHQQQAPQQIQIQHQQLNSRPKSAAPANSSSSSVGAFADHFLSSSAMAKFPNAAATIGGFPQGIVQSNGPSQSPQWKNMGRPASAVPSPSSASSSKSQQQPQQSSRSAVSHSQQQSMSSMNHQTQISFGSNSLKLPTVSGQQIVVGGGNPSITTGSVVASAVGSPQTTALLNNSKNTTTGSPRSSSSSMKGGLPSSKVSQIQHHQQQQAVASKSSPSSSSHSKSSPVNNRNAPSILGQPNSSTGAPPNSQNAAINKVQQQQQQLAKHQFPAPSQLFFSAPYMQAAAGPHSTHPANASAAAAAAAAAAAYYPRRPSDQPQQSQGKPSSSTGMLTLSSHPAISLASATVTTDPAKAIAVAAAANNVKMATAAASAAQYAQSAAAASQHSLMFPYIHIPSVPVKQAAAGDQNPASGNDSLHNCWQPEKR